MCDLRGPLHPCLLERSPLRPTGVSPASAGRDLRECFLPVSAMFDDAPLAVSCQDTPVRSVRSKKTAQTEKSLFAGSVSTEMSLKTRATANTSVRVHSCFASDEIPNSLAAAGIQAAMNIAGRAASAITPCQATSSRKLTIARSNHLTRRHAGATRDKSLWNRNWVEVFEVTSELPKEQRARSCPLCEGGLPFMSSQARRVAVQKHINQFHDGETLPSIARRRQTGRGAARESGFVTHHEERTDEEQGRRCPQQEWTRTGCDPASMGGMDGNEGIPSRAERGCT